MPGHLLSPTSNRVRHERVKHAHADPAQFPTAAIRSEPSTWATGKATACASAGVKRTAEEAQLPLHLETDVHPVLPDLTGAIAEESAAAATSDATAPVESRSATAPVWRARLELDESAPDEIPGH